MREEKFEGVKKRKLAYCASATVTHGDHENIAQNMISLCFIYSCSHSTTVGT
jgi:hypothetical protein